MKTASKIRVGIEPGPPVPIPPDPPDPSEPVPPLPDPRPEPEPPEPDRASALLRLAEFPRIARDRALASRGSVSIVGGMLRMRRLPPPTTS